MNNNDGNIVNNTICNFLPCTNIIITHSETALFNLNARVEARGTIVPKAAGRGHYSPERRHKGI